MRKGATTRELILEQTAPLFNQRGYAGLAMSDIMAATGLEKGGVYRHFESKEVLALAAFDHAIRRITDRLLGALQGKTSAVERITAILDFWDAYAIDPVVAGGCPVMNTAIESDDTHPALRTEARKVMDRYQRLIRRIVREGVSVGLLRDDLDIDAFASVMLSTLEGALMMSMLYRDPIHMTRATTHLAALLRGYVVAGTTRRRRSV
jgi:TetR/AcrR family transcriptional regulator, transcriptional repressor for nem operon